MAWVAVGGAVASAAIGYGANKLAGGGGGSSLTSFAPPGFDAGGIHAQYAGDRFLVGPTAERTAAVGNISNTFGAQADAIGGLRQTVTPGFSQARTAALGQIENARSSSIGNLRENLQRRRVLGSSFGQDAVSRTEAEFAQQKATTEAQSYMAELEATQQLMQQEFTARRGQYQTTLDEMNLEASIAAGLTGKATDVLAKNSQIEAMLDAQAAQGAGKFFGQLAQPVGAAVGKSIGSSGKTALDNMPTNI